MDNLPLVKGSYRFEADLSRQCWFKVGGKAKLLFKPEDAADLVNFLKQFDMNIPIFTMGVGSNLLIKDEGFDGCVIRLGRGFNYIKQDGQNIICGAACLDINVAQYALETSLGGLEFLSGIPGTIGGALAMNAGAYGGEISQVLVAAVAINRAGELRTFTPDELGFSYRNKQLSEEWIFTEAVLKGVPDDKNIISEKMNDIANKRQQSQPIRSRTSGSTFCNPPGMKAWQLIDEAGCRGLQIGGARVSDMHCNFFINTGDATATDIIDLITEVKAKVFEHSGVLLKEEIKIL